MAKSGRIHRKSSGNLNIGRFLPKLTPKIEGEVSISETPPTKPPTDPEILSCSWSNLQCTFPDLFAFLGELAEIYTVTVTRGGINFRAMDPSHVAMVTLHLDIEDFSKFKFIPPEITWNHPLIKNTQDTPTFTLNVKHLHQKISLFSEKRDVLKIGLTKDDVKQRTMHFSCRRFKFNQSFSDEEDEEVPDPSIEFNLNYGARTTELNEFMLVAQYLDSDYVTFDYQPDRGLQLMGSSADHPEFSKQIPLFGNIPTTKERFTGLFSLEYLLDILKMPTSCVQLNLKTDYPLLITSKITRNSYFEVWLACRVEEDDDDYEEREQEREISRGMHLLFSESEKYE